MYKFADLQLKLAALVIVLSASAIAQTTAFSFQGKLSDGGIPANGSYDLQFRIYDSLAGGTQVGSSVGISGVIATGGIFSVELDFGAGAFDGGDRWLEIAVSPAGAATFTTLAPRQRLGSSPYAIRSLSSEFAETAIDSASLGGLPAASFVNTTDPRLSDARQPLPGSNDYVRNSDTSQTANFNIGGSGRAEVFNANDRFEIAGVRVLSTPGTNNLFLGKDAGASNDTGVANVFLGHFAGNANTSGFANSFLGRYAGASNTTGFFNTFVGHNTGTANSSGELNTFIGVQAGQSNSTGKYNSFFGATAASQNITGNNLTMLGYDTRVGASDLQFATAIGSRALVGANDTIVLGKIAGNYNGQSRPADRVVIPGDLNVVGSFSAGSFTASIFDAASYFSIGGERVLANPGTRNIFGGFNAGLANTGTDNSFFGWNSGRFNTSGTNNAFYGASSGYSNTTGANNSFFGANSGNSNTTGSSNSFFGSSAGLFNTTGTRNAFYGDRSGLFNTTGRDNAFFGFASGENTTVGLYNVFVGSYSGAANTTGGQNTFVGAETGRALTSGFQNTFVGSRAGRSATGGADNILVGYDSGTSLTTGDGNTYIGTRSGQSLTSGRLNTFIGIGSGGQVTTGVGNLGIGYGAGTQNSTGSGNIFIGGNSGVQTGVQVTDSIAIGNNVLVGASNTIAFGTASQTTIINGRFRILNGASESTPAVISYSSPAGGGLWARHVYFANPSQLFSQSHLCHVGATDGVPANVLTFCSSSFSSDANKRDIQPFSMGLDVLGRLNPVKFRFTGNNLASVGLSAEEVNALAPELVSKKETGEVDEVSEAALITLLINSVKQQQKQIEELKRSIAKLEAELARTDRKDERKDK
ncbi:MAG: tail fiber domain-containing protein [Acidobacteria bacterium]|nr:tail fiber domain-containing protein [Acidobacteriota bacterium]